MPRPDSVTAPALEGEQETRRRESRRRRYALRAGLWQLSSLKGVKGCARNVNQTAGVATLVRTGKGAGYEGLQLCSNLWACPCCSARIRQSRALDVERVGLAHLNAGRGLYFLTLTMPHDDADRLADLLDVVLGAWRDVQQRKGFRALREQHRLAFIRSTEVTYTSPTDAGSGWHPHLHLLIFTDAHLSDDARADMLGKIEGWWAHAITRRTRPDGTHYRRPGLDGVGVNLQDVSGSTGTSKPGALFAYLTKVQDGYGDAWNVGTELLRGDLKKGRKLSRTPLELASAALGLDLDDEGNRVPASPQLVSLWHEYEAATKSRKCIHWSDGLRARYLEDDELADEQVPELEGPAEIVATFSATLWRAVCRKRWMPAALLDYAEQGDLQALDDLLDTVRADLEHGNVPRGAAPPGRLSADWRSRSALEHVEVTPCPAPTPAYLRRLVQK